MPEMGQKLCTVVITNKPMLNLCGQPKSVLYSTYQNHETSIY